MSEAGFEGSFVDGKSPVRRTVIVSLDGNDLHIFGNGADVRWPLKKIRADDSPGQGEYFISVRGDHDARLNVKRIPVEVMAVLKQRVPKAFSKKHIHRQGLMLVLTLACVASVLVGAAFFGVPRLAKPLAQMVPPAIEARMGQGVLAQVDQAFGKPIDNPPAQAQLQHVVNRIDAAAHAGFPLRAHLIDSDMSNAFALPGGNIVVTCPLIQELQNPAELQAVLAHEIAHVTKRHVMTGLIRAVGAQISLAALTGAGGGQTLVSIANQAAQMSYTREDEAEADRTALEYLDSAKLDASGLATFFDRLAAAKGEKEERGAFMSSHPTSKSRADAARRQPKGPDGQALNGKEWIMLKTACTPKE